MRLKTKLLVFAVIILAVAYAKSGLNLKSTVRAAIGYQKNSILRTKRLINLLKREHDIENLLIFKLFEGNELKNCPFRTILHELEYPTILVDFQHRNHYEYRRSFSLNTAILVCTQSPDKFYDLLRSEVLAGMNNNVYLVYLEHIEISNLQNFCKECFRQDVYNVLIITESFTAFSTYFVCQKYTAKKDHYQLKSLQCPDENSTLKSLFHDMHGAEILTQSCNLLPFSIGKQNNSENELRLGYIAKIVNNFAERRNATVIWNEVSTNIKHTPYEIMTKSAENKSMDIGLISMSQALISFNLSSYPISVDKMCYVIPLPAHKPIKLFFFKIFQFNALVIILLLIVIYDLLLNYSINQSRISKTFRQTCPKSIISDKTLRAMLGSPFLFPSESRFSAHFLCVQIFLLSLWTMTLYQVLLGSWITQPPLNSIIRNGDDIEAANLKILAIDVKIKIPFATLKKSHPHLFKYVSFTEFIDKFRNFDTNYIYPIEEKYWLMLNEQQKYFDPKLFYYSSELCISRLMLMVLPIRSKLPYRDLLNMFILRTHETGLFQLWSKQNIHGMVRIKAATLKDLNKPKKLAAALELKDFSSIVGYRSLRGSHSISDLSLAGNLDGSRTVIGANRYAKPVASNEPIQQYSKAYYEQQHNYIGQPMRQHNQTSTQADVQTYVTNQPTQQLFFNCAASKSVLQQNCQAMRQVQQHYPPYPHHVGVHQIHPPPGVPFMTSSQQQQQNHTHINAQTGKPFNSTTLPAKKTQNVSNLEALRAKRNSANNSRRTPSILKHYKSCPVSPVHEEVEWTNGDNKSIIISEPKRHSVYAEDARSILDIIHTDTEKMIKEITRKYGDLDDISLDVYEPNLKSRFVNSYSMPANLSQPCTTVGTPPTPEIREIRGVPYTIYNPAPPLPYMHHQKTTPPVPTKRATSEYYIYEEFYHCQRKVSLSDILNENPSQICEARRLAEARFLETQRHSSASFFLGGGQQNPELKSQESLLSTEDYLANEGSYCNSMESVLSDESDCKSAPIDVQRHAGIRNFIIHGQVIGEANGAQMISKSYGSSPNAYGSFDYFMHQHNNQILQPTSSPYDSFDVSNYDLNAVKQLPKTKTYPKATNLVTKTTNSSIKTKKDDIPTLSSKNKQYNAGVSKSISQDFAQRRHQRGSYFTQIENRTAYDDVLFTKKSINTSKPPIPAKPQSLFSALSSNMERTVNSAGSDLIKKSCSFEVGLTKKVSNSRTASVIRKFERNLQKFEHEKQAELHTKQRSGMRSSVSSSALATQSCLKKVSKFDTSKHKSKDEDKNDAAAAAAASRRATSMRTRARPKISVRFNTVSQIKYTPSVKRNTNFNDNKTITTTTTTTCPLNDINRNETSSSSTVNSLISDCGEKSFELYISGNGNEHENMNMDSMESLKLYTKPELQAIVDEIQIERARDIKLRKNLVNVERTTSNDASTTNQCKNIAKKIDIVQKLIEMEERKLEQIRLATETRMRPFECNSKQKGYVKSLTMNFDMLAKGIEKDTAYEQHRKNIESADADLCAYARHIKRNASLPDVLESNDVLLHSYLFNKTHDDVELATEVKADSDAEAEEAYTANNEHDSEKIRNDYFGIKHQGTPKNLNPMPIEESSIRRACSLSDLHMGNFGKGGKSNVSQSKSSMAYRNSSATRSATKRNSLQFKGSTSNLGGTSSSIGVLNQASDSENEDINRSRLTPSQNRSNGPNAANRQYGNKNVNVNNRSRKGLQTNFSNAVPLQDDSSSEETPGVSSGGKPTVPPRPRNLAFDKNKFVNNTANNVKQRSMANAYDSNIDSPNLDGNDPKAQVHNVINKLYTTTQTVMQLHANLKNCEDSLMLKELENAVIMTQNMLTNITQNKSDKTNLQQSNNADSNFGKGNGNNSNAETMQTNLDNGDYLMVVNNCRDLVNNVKMKHKSDDCENNS